MRRPHRADGIRDRAMLHLCYAGGLRVSELIGLRLDDLTFSHTPACLIHGKGRRERCLPLWKTTTAALASLVGGERNRIGARALRQCARRVALLAQASSTFFASTSGPRRQRCPSLVTKRVFPTCLRAHLRANDAAGDERSSKGFAVAWSRPTCKRPRSTRARILSETGGLGVNVPPKLRSGRFKATDALIASLRAANLMQSKKPSK